MPSDPKTALLHQLREWGARAGCTGHTCPAELSDAAADEIERLRAFAQWVADHSNDPAVVHQAVLHGADLAKEQAR